MILLISDCVSPAWQTRRITEVLNVWGRDHPTAIVQMLPQRLWSGTALGEETRVSLRCPWVGAANSE